jgi:hypothetical protein
MMPLVLVQQVINTIVVVVAEAEAGMAISPSPDLADLADLHTAEYGSLSF